MVAKPRRARPVAMVSLDRLWRTPLARRERRDVRLPAGGGVTVVLPYRPLPGRPAGRLCPACRAGVAPNVLAGIVSRWTRTGPLRRRAAGGRAAAARPSLEIE